VLGQLAGCLTSRKRTYAACGKVGNIDRNAFYDFDGSEVDLHLNGSIVDPAVHSGLGSCVDGSVCQSPYWSSKYIALVEKRNEW
jgi:hypothetical protein